MRTLFFFLVLVTTLSLNAQITKGNWLVGGNGSFSESIATSEDSFGNEIKSKVTSLRLNPNIGYFLIDKLALGIDFSIDYANSQGANNSNWSIGVGPFARYYFLKPEKLINIFSEANFAYGTGLSATNKNRNGTTIGFGAGGVLFFNSSVGLELSLNYSTTTSRSDGNPNTNFDNLFLSLGFQIHLEK